MHTTALATQVVVGSGVPIIHHNIVACGAMVWDLKDAAEQPSWVWRSMGHMAGL